jgi:hypothetical protein
LAKGGLDAVVQDGSRKPTLPQSARKDGAPNCSTYSDEEMMSY